MRNQIERQLAVSCELGTDALLLHRFEGREELGRVFAFELDLLSEHRDVPFDKALGRPISVRLADLSGGASPRYFHGHVSRFRQTDDRGSLSRYSATMVPWLWFLGRTQDCRVFQHKSAVEIVTDVFRDNGFHDFQLALTAEYPTREYCVQYRESDLNFISRLLESEGIYYYFVHEEHKHTLVLCDSPAVHTPLPGYERFVYGSENQRIRSQERVHRWSIDHRVQPTRFAATDYDFARPKTDLSTASLEHRKHGMSELDVFEYPGGYSLRSHGEHYAKIRIEELQAAQQAANATSNIRGVAVGRTFSLAQHPRADQAGDHLVIAAHHRALSDEFGSVPTAASSTPYECEFTCIPAMKQYRPERLTPKARVEGPQTAVVTGLEGQEIYIDRHARVKVQFHWDRYGKRDQDSSCWIRVNQPWAGKNFGGLCVPRLGQEVIVDFLEGDPDRPIITGRVYNGASMPPISSAGKHVNPGVPKPQQPHAAANAGRAHAGPAAAPRPAIGPEAINAGNLPHASEGIFEGPKSRAWHPTVNPSNGVMSPNAHPDGPRERPRRWMESTEISVAGSPRPTTNGEVRSNDLHSALSPVSATTLRYNELSVEPPASGSVVEAAMMTSIKSNSLKETGGFNEITMNDSSGEESMYIKAQLNEMHEVGNDEMTVIGNNRVTEVKNNSQEKIGQNAQEEVGVSKVIDVGTTLVIKAGTSITFQCGASTLHMNQAGFITLSGMVINIAGGVNCNMAAPMTNIVGGILMTTTGAINLSSGALNKITGGMLASMSGGQTEVLAGTTNVINGAKVLVNC